MGDSSQYMVCFHFSPGQPKAVLNQMPCTCHDRCKGCNKEVPKENQGSRQCETSDDYDRESSESSEDTTSSEGSDGLLCTEELPEEIEEVLQDLGREEDLEQINTLNPDYEEGSDDDDTDSRTSPEVQNEAQYVSEENPEISDDHDKDSRKSPGVQNGAQEVVAGNPPFRHNGKILPSMVTNIIHRHRNNDNPYSLIPIDLNAGEKSLRGAQV